MTLEVGKKYVHYANKNIYEIVLFSIREEDGASLVSYRDDITSKVYTRPRTEFEASVLVPRFTEYADEEGLFGHSVRDGNGNPVAILGE